MTVVKQTDYEMLLSNIHAHHSLNCNYCEQVVHLVYSQHDSKILLTKLYALTKARQCDMSLNDSTRAINTKTLLAC